MTVTNCAEVEVEVEVGMDAESGAVDARATEDVCPRLPGFMYDAGLGKRSRELRGPLDQDRGETPRGTWGFASLPPGPPRTARPRSHPLVWWPARVTVSSVVVESERHDGSGHRSSTPWQAGTQCKEGSVF